MSKLRRGAGLLIIAGLTGLAGCGTTQAVSPGAAKSPAPASSTPAPRTTTPSPSATDKPTVTPGGTSGACSWLNGHQPWLANPLMVVQVWAGSPWSTAVIRQVDASTFKVTEPGGKVDTVTGTRPVSVPGPWVITKITYG